MQSIFSKGIAVKLTLFCLLSILAIWLIPKLDPSTEGPGSVTLLGVGLVTTFFTAGVLYFGVNSSLNLPKKLLLFAFLYNGLIIAVKFVLSPLSLYQANRINTFVLRSFADDRLFNLVIPTAIIFVLYFLVFSLFYVHFKVTVLDTIEPAEVEKRTVSSETKERKFFVIWGLAALVGILIFVGSVLFFTDLVTTFLLSMLLPILSAVISFQYLYYIFSTVFGILIALALVGAIYFVRETFQSAAEQAIILRDVTVLASFFWVGVAFLFMYHALWVVYLLILTTLWPLRVVVAK